MALGRVPEAVVERPRLTERVESIILNVPPGMACLPEVLHGELADGDGGCPPPVTALGFRLPGTRHPSACGPFFVGVQNADCAIDACHGRKAVEIPSLNLPLCCG